MAVQLVKVVNANGRVGLVAETHPHLSDMRLAPSERSEEVPVNLTPQDDPAPAGFGPSGDEADHYDSGESVADDNEE